jgi:hypothetical protein
MSYERQAENQPNNGQSVLLKFLKRFMVTGLLVWTAVNSASKFSLVAWPQIPRSVP